MARTSRADRKAARAATDPGPLAPWRFSVTVTAAFVVGVLRLPDLDVSHTSVLEEARVRALAAGVLVWTVLGVVNRILRAVALAEAETAARTAAVEDVRHISEG